MSNLAFDHFAYIALALVTGTLDSQTRMYRGRDPSTHVQACVNVTERQGTLRPTVVRLLRIADFSSIFFRTRHALASPINTRSAVTARDIGTLCGNLSHSGIRNSPEEMEYESLGDSRNDRLSLSLSECSRSEIRRPEDRRRTKRVRETRSKEDTHSRCRTHFRRSIRERLPLNFRANALPVFHSSLGDSLALRRRT